MKRTNVSAVGTRRVILASVASIGLASPGAVLAQAPQCDDACLTGLTADYLTALVAQDSSNLSWASRVRFTENDVALMIGDGLWGTATKVEPGGFTLADPSTGNVLWLGVVEEHGESAYLALRLGVDGDRIADVETVLGRRGTPGDYAPSGGYHVDPVFSERLPRNDRVPRARMIALADGYYDTMQLNDGVLLTEIADDCVRVSNGVTTTTRDDVDVSGCRQQFEIGLYRPVDRVRARRYPIVDEARGVVVALAFLDRAARYVDYTTLDGKKRSIDIEYPNTRGVLELFKIENGKIKRVEGVASFQPYLMPTIWVP
jgi:hypothetical protein